LHAPHGDPNPVISISARQALLYRAARDRSIDRW
jgi:hypothetical protein